MKRSGKHVMNVSAPAEAAVCAFVDGDHVATVGREPQDADLLPWRGARTRPRPRRHPAALQGRHPHDAWIFTWKEGFKDENNRAWTSSELKDWKAERAQAGRVVPRGFAKSGEVRGGVRDRNRPYASGRVLVASFPEETPGRGFMNYLAPDAKAANARAGELASAYGRNGVPEFSAAYRSYVLVLLTLVYVVNYLDRQILGILNAQIKAEFHISNTLIGLLGGPVFALMYATLGIPIAVLADRLNRRNIIVASLTIFSLMTVLSAYAAQFWQLALARFGTGIGEAGTGPSINAMLADLYPPQQRASALAFYSAGLNVGLLFAFFGGGWVAEHYGWRVALLAAGSPGLALGILLLTSVREPQRGQIEKLPDTAEPPGLIAVVRFLLGQRSFLWLSVGTAMSAFGGYAGITFIPMFLATSHHMSLPAIGLVLAVLTGGVGAVGTYLAGWFADVFGRRDLRWNLYIPIIATFIALPCTPVFYLSANLTVALLAGIGPALTGAAFVGPAYALAQALVPLRMRARAAAILLFILNIIALCTAAPLVGLISDLLRPSLGADSLRYALMTGMIAGALGAYCYWRASRTVRSDVARAIAASAA